MNMGLILSGVLGIVICILLGMAFSIMESAILALNRSRLLQLFADEHPEETDEQEIFRDTKEVYFVSRLGLCVVLVVGGFCAFVTFHEILTQFLDEQTFPSLRLLAAALTLLVVVPVFLFSVYGVPRLIMRQPLLATGSEVPAWMRIFLRLVRPWGKLARIRNYLPLGAILAHHRLTKTELVALVTDLEIAEKETPAAAGGDRAGTGGIRRRCGRRAGRRGNHL